MSETQFTSIDLWKNGILVILGATIINVINYLIFEAAGAYDGVINANTDEEIAVTEIITASIMQALVGLIVFYLIFRFTARAIYNFRIIGTIALVISFALPFTLENSTTGAFISLQLMHLVSGLGMLLALPYLLTKS